MSHWINFVTLGTSSMYVLILTDNKNNKTNTWNPPNVLVMPVDANDADIQPFDMDALTVIPHFKRKPLADILVRLNERDAGDYRWTAYRLKVCDDGGLMFTVKAHSPTVGEDEDYERTLDGNADKGTGNAGGGGGFTSGGFGQTGFGGGNQTGFGSASQTGFGTGGANQIGFGSGNKGGFGNNHGGLWNQWGWRHRVWRWHWSP
ncbi:hypothetical protein TWF281_008085 [Arthrobotrys megalospora]